MPDTVLPIRGMTSQEKAVSLHMRPVSLLYQISGWEGFDVAAGAVLRRLSLDLPPDFRTPVLAGNRSAWRIAPGRILLHCDVPPACDDVNLTFLDLSDARVRLRIEGDGASDLVACVAPINVSAHAFPIGSFVQSGLRGIPVLIQRGDTWFELLIPTTWAKSLISLLAAHVTLQVM